MNAQLRAADSRSSGNVAFAGPPRIAQG